MIPCVVAPLPTPPSRRESKIASSEKMKIGGTAEMAWMQICDPSDKEKGLYTIEISDGVKTHARTFDLSGQGKVFGEGVLQMMSQFGTTFIEGRVKASRGPKPKL